MMDKNLFQYKGSKKIILITGFLTIAEAFAIIYQAVFLAKAVVRMYEGAASSAVLSAFFYFFAFFLAKNLLQRAKSRIVYSFASCTANDYREKLVRKIFTLGPREMGKYGSGSAITLALEGIPNFRTYLELFIPRFISVMLIPPAVLIYVFQKDIISGVVLLVVMPILIAFLILLGLVAGKQKDAKWKSYQLLASHFVDSLRGLVTLKYLGISKRHEQTIYQVSEQYRKATIRTLRVAFLSSFSLDFFSTLSVAVVAVELGLRLINGVLDFEPALAILILAPEYFSPVKELGNDYHATMDGKEAGEQIHSLLKRADLTESSINIAAKEDIGGEGGRGLEKMGAGSVINERFGSVSLSNNDHEILNNDKEWLNRFGEGWNEKSTLILENITKAADGEDRFILQNIHFHAKGFQKIGVIGLSGAGKTTLVDILSGFSRPSEGSILLNGKRLDHLCFPGWQRQVNYIPQHPYIFSGTFAENIALYAPDAPKEKIMESAEITGLANLIKQLPNGLDEMIGQGGRALSGGEEQRIALARTILDSRPILLFDEPTAHLDIETEYEIKKTLLPLLDQKLVFFATHRLHWMQNMDWILVIENGMLAEQGPPHELYERKGGFYRLREAIWG